MSVACCFFNVACKKFEHIFNFVKVINRNSVGFFHLGYNKNGFFDDVIITSALRSDMAINVKDILTL